MWFIGISEIGGGVLGGKNNLLCLVLGFIKI
jgi:hypothetical protein